MFVLPALGGRMRSKAEVRCCRSLIFLQTKYYSNDVRRVRLKHDCAVVAGESERVLLRRGRTRQHRCQNENHRPTRLTLLHASAPLAVCTARSTACALFMLSSYSVAGSESATMPAPACKSAFLPFISMVRIAMHESRFPAKSAYNTEPP